MELQFHPASGRGAVRTVALGERHDPLVLAAAGLCAALAVSLWITVPFVCRRAGRAEGSSLLAQESAKTARARRGLEARLDGMRDRALDGGDLVSRIAFLYGVPLTDWPRRLNPESGALAPGAPEAVAQGLGAYAIALERAVALVADREVADAALPRDTPSMLPLSTDLVEPASRFGPRVSPWTGSEEFFAGIDLAAPAGAPVLAPAAGTVVFAGRVPTSSNARLWRFGNVVVLSHGGAGVTVFGHLARVEVRRGERVRRGSRLGTVGTTGWAMSPALHYEYWRRDGSGLAATDPRFAMLDFKIAGHDVSLERMRATSAPDAVQPPPDR